MTDTVGKRRLSPENEVGANKKVKKQWHNRGSKTFTQSLSVNPGDAGIFATCPRNKEIKCVKELTDLLHEYAEQLYNDEQTREAGEQTVDIQAEVNAEVDGMQKPEKEPLFSNIRLDIPCVVFFKTRLPVNPVSLVQKICEDALTTGKQRTRFTLRLSPMDVMGHASERGLDEAATKALAPHFHAENASTKKFAIKPSLRNHDPNMTRDMVIKQVATKVGDKHKVNLKSYDLLILIEVYKHICGIGVVTADFEKLKRFNLAEIYAPGSGAAMSSAKSSE